MVDLASPVISVVVNVPSVYALFLLVGQSNMVGKAVFDGGADYPSNVRQWLRTNEDAAAAYNLDHPTTEAGNFGLALQHAIDFVAANPTVTPVYIPRAVGGSGFSNDAWNVGDSRYDIAVADSNSAITHYGVDTLSGILWHQGERDVAFSENQYATALDAMIAGMRSEITGASSVPFVAGEIGQFLSDPTARNAAITDLPNRVANTAAVSSVGLTDLGDGLHFDAASIRTLGSRYYTAWSAI